MRPLAAALLSVLLLGSLAGCGDPIKNYCGALSKDQPKLASMLSGSGATALIDNLPVLEDLRSKAPSDIAPDWSLFIAAIKGLDRALKAADVKPSAYAGGKRPTGLSAAQTKAIAAAADRLSSADVVAAASGIDQEAKDVCQIDLGV